MEVMVVVAMGAMLGGFVQGISGFAFGMVSMSVWIWALEPHLAAILMIFGSLVGQFISLISLRRGFELPLLLPFIVGGLPGIGLGILLLPYLDMEWFKALFGAFLLIWSVAMCCSGRLPRLRGGGQVADAIVGLLAGIMGGIAGLAGPLPTLWCSVRGVAKEQQRSIVQNFSSTVLLVTMASYLFKGWISLAMIPLLGVVTLSVLLPTLLGVKLYRGLSEERFRQLVLGLLMVSGLAMLSSSVPALWAR